MPIKEFSKKLKEARLESGLSQRSLGLSVGLSDKTISSYESSRSYPNLEILKKISEILKKSPDYFLLAESDKELLLQKISKLEKENALLRKMINRVE